jgi:hypothetical protein
MSEHPSTKKCIACQGDIPELATVCPHCSTKQDRRLNFLQNVGAVIALISAILAFASYVVTSIPTVRQTLFWKDDVNVLSYSDRHVVIGNNGDGDVFVSYVQIKTESRSKIVRIAEMVKPGEFIAVDKELFKGGGWKVVSGVSNAEWEDLLGRQTRDRTSTTGECIIMEFASENDPGYRNYIDFLGDKLRTVEGSATIYFFSNQLGKELSKSFPVHGILSRNEKSCADSLVQ